MLLRVDPSAATPLATQIAAAVRQSIAAGDVTRGERLPAARELAESLGVNLHTVLRAYAVLRDEGLIELRRGRGAVVTGEQPALQARLRTACAAFVAEARELGVSVDDAVALVREEMS